MFVFMIPRDVIFIRAFVEDFLQTALVFVLGTIDVVVDTVYQLSLVLLL